MNERVAVQVGLTPAESIYGTMLGIGLIEETHPSGGHRRTVVYAFIRFDDGHYEARYLSDCFTPAYVQGTLP